MEVKDELLKDLEQDVYDAYSIWASRACDGNGAEGAFKTIATHLASLGYRKVTTCSECKYWHPRGNDGDIRTGYCTQGYEPLGWEVSEYSEYHFCSAGEPKEDPS